MLPTGRGAGGGVETGVAHGGAFSKALGAAFSRAFLFRSCSRSLQRVVSTSTVSARSFFSVASSVIFIRHASRSTLRLSLSKSSGLRAGDFVFVFFWTGALALPITIGGGATVVAVSIDKEEAVADVIGDGGVSTDDEPGLDGSWTKELGVLGLLLVDYQDLGEGSEDLNVEHMEKQASSVGNDLE